MSCLKAEVGNLGKATSHTVSVSVLNRPCVRLRSGNSCRHSRSHVDDVHSQVVARAIDPPALNHQVIVERRFGCETIQ